MNTIERKQKVNLVGANGVNVVLGIWVLISPFILAFAGFKAVMWNSVAVGIVVALLALSRNARNRSSEVLNVVLGIWLIISAFLLVPMAAVAFWNSIILGFIIALAALAAHGMHRSTRLPADPSHIP